MDSFLLLLETQEIHIKLIDLSDGAKLSNDGWNYITKIHYKLFVGTLENNTNTAGKLVWI